MDLTALLPALGKSTAAVIILAVSFGLGHLITAIRGGKVSADEKASITERLSSLEEWRVKAERRIERLTKQFHDMRSQRDQARNYAQFLELTYHHDPPRKWPDDPALEDE